MRTTESARRELHRIVELFETGKVGEAIAHVAIPQPDTPGSKWSYGNRLLVFLSGTADARGFQQWKAAGRRVKKGSKAVYILAPTIIRKKDEETGERTDKEICIGFRAVPVFRVEDTDGDPLPTCAPTKPPPLADVAAIWNIDTGYIPYNGTYWGFFATRDSKDYIRLATHEEGVFFHELAHAAHKRLDGELKGGQRPQQEIIAELTATVLMRLYGLQTDGTEARSYEYVKTYAEKTKKDLGQACLKVIDTVGKVLDLILSTTADVDQQTTAAA